MPYHHLKLLFYVITFINGMYIYTIYRNKISKDDEPEVTLEVLRNDQAVLTEDGKLTSKS